MRLRIVKYSLAIFLLTSVNIPVLADENIVEIESRVGVTQKFILIKPEHPTAAVLLIPGARGELRLGTFFGKPTINPLYATSFAVESRKNFAKNNLMVAVIDSPSDRNSQGMGWEWRVTEEHAIDLKSVIVYLKKQANVPVWLVGSSNSALSEANFVSRFGNGEVHGLAIGAAVTNITPDNPYDPEFSERYPEGVMSVSGLDSFTGPVLIYWHKDDGCILSPPKDAPRLAERFTKSARVEVKYIEGNAPPLRNSDPCKAGSTHDLHGVEDEGAAAIVQFILSNSGSAVPPTAQQGVQGNSLQVPHL